MSCSCVLLRAVIAALSGGTAQMNHRAVAPTTRCITLERCRMFPLALKMCRNSQNFALALEAAGAINSYTEIPTRSERPIT